ncbi:MAG: ribosome maturation factor RimM [Eubacterium sp.]|nr:ribosome maturation factor RimM [Eubacterium sp.]
MKEELMIIGKVLGAHGIRGELKVQPLTDDPGRFYDLDGVYLEKGGKRQAYNIELVRLHKGNVLLTLEGIADRNASEKAAAAMVCIDREDAVDLEEDEYFIEDLIGMTVLDEGGQVVGKVKNIIQTSGTVDTVEIVTADKTVYVPARKVYFKQVDLAAGKIVAAIPEELLTL